MMNTDVEYYLNGKNFKDFGVFVTASEGLIGQLERKEVISIDWPDYHGVSRSRLKPRYKERTITLSCMIESAGRVDFVNKVNAFFAQFDKHISNRLKVEYDGQQKPLVYEVILASSSDVYKQWGQSSEDPMIGTFKLKLIEDEPVKRVLRHNTYQSGTIASITINSTTKLNVHWGDGEHTYDVQGNTSLTHQYKNSGQYEIVITGVIEEAKSITSNATTIWDILK